jgi:glycosyltransferase involved in cell wall biosynthesis
VRFKSFLLILIYLVSRATERVARSHFPAFRRVILPGLRWLNSLLIVPRPVPIAGASVKQRLLVDVSSTANAKRLSGIQRSVNSLISALLRTKDHLPLEPVPIRFSYQHMGFVEARSYSHALMGKTPEDDVALAVEPDDILLMLDASWDLYPVFAKVLFPVIRSVGGRIVSCAYDIIPVSHPHLFEKPLRHMFRRWFKQAVTESDLIISISAATRDAVAMKIKDVRPELPLDFFHLGADFQPAEAASQTKFIPSQSGARFLMVGTIEPRKGHATVLAAFEELWQHGSTDQLVLVGARGWMVDAFLKRLDNHPELGKRLHVFHNADDALLHSAYKECDALIAASMIEGFGLPLIEAARAGKALVVSDIPAFREICGERAIYFTPGKSDELVEILRTFPVGKYSQTPIEWLTWDESAEMLVARIAGQFSSSPERSAP